MIRRARVALAVLAAATASPAAASVTQFWTVNRAADYREAELTGTAVSASGLLHVGARAEGTDVPGPGVAWALAPDGTEVLVGTGPEGVLYRLRGDRSVVADSSGSGQILALARGPDGALYGGTAPDGRVVRWSGGQASTWFQTADKYVWGLAWSNGTLYAVTGPEGYLYAVRAHDRGDAVFHAPSGQITAVVSDGRGGCFFGTSGKGAIYRHDGGRTRSLLEVTESDVKSLVFDRGVLYAAAVTVAPVRWDTPASGSTESAAPVTSSEAKSVVYRIVPDSSAVAWWRSTQGIVFALAPRAGGGVWAATGSRAGLYSVDERGQAEAVFVAAEGNATALAPAADGLWLATSNPVRVYRVRAPATSGEARSAVFDAGRMSRWGRFLPLGVTGGARFATRSGNTSTPDSTWTDWQSAREGSPVPSPSARYLQWRAQLDGAAAVREVRVAYAEVNQPPRIEEFTAYPEPGRYYRGEITPRQDPITQVLPGGTRVQYSVPSPPPGAPEIMPTWATGLRPLQWRTSDPNGDPVRARLDFRRVGTSAWTPIDDDIETPPYTWDTNGLAEGDYELRLTVSDADRQGEDGLSDELTISPLTVDHTPPTLSGVEARAQGREVRVTGEARDAGLYVAQVDVRVDNGDWRPARAVDGLWDAASERFEARLAELEPGDHQITVRAADAVGNLTTFVTHVVVR